MTARFRLRLGNVEVEYEVDNREGLDDITSLIPDVADALDRLDRHDRPSGRTDTSDETDSSTSGGEVTGTTRTIASQLQASSGSDLVMAAAVRLTLVEGNDTFTRQQLLDEMRNASGYYKTSYRKNLTGYLTTLIKKGQLVEHSENTYALTPVSRRELQDELGR